MSKKVLASHDLFNLLKKKYKEKWYFVGEIGCGSPRADAGQGKGRLDAWAMRPAWSNPLYLGFEIKVSRSDFLRDDKWPQYLGACNQFYFVTPQGLVTKEEIPADAGLLEASTNAKVLKMVKKAPHSDVDYDQLFNVLKGRLMGQFYSPYSEQWKTTDEEKLKLMEEDEWGKVTGDAVAAKIHVKQIELKAREERLKKEADSMKEVQRFASRIGLSISSWARPSEKDVRQAWLRANGHLVPPDLRQLAAELENTGEKEVYMAERLRRLISECDKAALGEDDEKV